MVDLIAAYMGDGDPIEDYPPPSGRERLSQKSVNDFLAAAEARPPRDQARSKSVPPKPEPSTGKADLDAFWDRMMRLYPLRTRRLVKDVEWVRKHAKKNDIDPDDVKWLL